MVALLAAVGAGTAAYIIDTTAAVDPPEPSQASATPGTPVLSARRVPQWTTELMANRSLVAAVEPVVATAPPGTCVEVGNGTETLYVVNGELPLVPASNQKLLTAVAAAEILGDDTVLSTEFRAAAPPVNGVLEGNLWMVGGGDPLITSDAGQGRKRGGPQPETNLEAMADQVVAAGITAVTGALIGDDSRYDTQRSLPGWPERWLAGGTVAPLSALLVNDGWQVDPITGEGPGGPAPDPAANAAAALATLLSERGVTFGAFPASGVAPADAQTLLSVPSLPVSALAGQILRYSDNTTAELLLKEIGLEVSAEGSTAAGAAAVADWAAAEGLAVSGANVTDGSGLSSTNLVTCELLASVLRSQGPDGGFAAGLAVPGQPGTLADRFPGDEWAERLRAKTGTLNEVTALSGWLVTRPGATLDFEIVTNTSDRRVNADDIALQSRVLTALLDQPVAPPLEQAGPLPPEGA